MRADCSCTCQMAYAIHLSNCHPLRSESSPTAIHQHLPRNSSFLYQNSPPLKKKNNKQPTPKATISPLTIFHTLGYFAVQPTEKHSALSTPNAAVDHGSTHFTLGQQTHLYVWEIASLPALMVCFVSHHGVLAWVLSQPSLHFTLQVPKIAIL